MAVVTGDGSDNLLFGTNGADIISGLGGNDKIIGSRRNDTIDGGTGTDTVDYTALNRKVTLRSQGAIVKEGAGTDTINNIEEIIGATGKRNLIDGITGGGGPARFVVDLSANSLQVAGIPVPGGANFVVKNFLDVNGTVNDDSIVGDGADNIFGGSTGNDFLNGKGGNDTVDYSNLGQAVTLERVGAINKGSAGTDQIEEIETIIGARNLKNAIDGTNPNSSPVSFDLDLGAEKLTVKNIPGLGSATFTVKNFVNVTGTSNSDSLVGDRKVNIFTGSKGNDLIDGAGGRDTVDYSDLGQAVTLKALGAIDKGSAGTDNILAIETIIGAVGKDNAIDGTVPGGNGTVSFDANLSSRRLTVKNIPGIGTQRFGVENFVDVTGTSNNDLLTGDGADNILVGLAGNDRLAGRDGNDEITGDAGNDKLFGEGGDDLLNGGAGNDVLRGGQGVDVLIGAGVPSISSGFGEVDRLFGGVGQDTFVLGDSSRAFYRSGGNRDFADIQDFASGLDKIRLFGSVGDYSFDAAKKKIFFNDTDGPELIAKSRNTFNVATDFVFV